MQTTCVLRTLVDVENDREMQRRWPSQLASSLASTPPGMPGTHPPPQYFGWGDVKGNISPILLRTFGYSRPILVALRSLSLKPISFGYKTPPVRFSQAYKARPTNLELALTPLRKFHSIPFHRFISGNKAHTDETKIRQEYRESVVQRKRIDAQISRHKVKLAYR